MMKQEPKALTAREVSAVYGINPGTLANLRWLKQGPPYYHRGRRVLYRPEDVEKWLFAKPVLTAEAHEDSRRESHDSHG